MTLSVRPLEERDLPQADRVFRLAFGTHLGLPEPADFGRGTNSVFTRWHADPLSSLGAFVDGELVGSNFAARWGSFGFFGPLTVHPDRWNQGVGRGLVKGVVDLLDGWEVRLAGLYTFAESPKHVGLYQRFGFWPRSLTQLWSLEVPASSTAVTALEVSGLEGTDAEEALRACRDIAGWIYDGLDLTAEIRAVLEQGLGEVLVLSDEDVPSAFAICHIGEGSEAGLETVYVKFAGARSKAAFERLLAACVAVASQRGVRRLVLGVNTAREGACRLVAAAGFSVLMHGVAMHRPNDPGFSRSDSWIIDDWR